MTRTRFPLGPEPVLREALRTAGRALRADASGETHVWELPPGEIRLAHGVELGMPGCDLRVEATGTTVVVDDAVSEPDGGLAAGVRLIGRRVAMSGLGVRAAAAGHLVGLDVSAQSAVLSGIRCTGLRADEVTAVRVRGGRLRLAELDVTQVSARSGAAVGLDVDVTGRVDVRGARLGGLSGDTVSGARLAGAGGAVDAVALSDLRPRATGDAALVTISVSEAIEVTGLSAVREIGGGDPAAALAAAQAALERSPRGTRHTWLLPPGMLSVPAGLACGDADHALSLRGRRSGTTVTELRVGVGTPIAGDLVALSVTGTEVGIDELAVRAAATGSLTGVQVRADRADVADLTLRQLRGSDVIGLDVTTGPDGEAGVVDLSVDDVRATGEATGVLVTAARMVLTRATVTRVSGTARSRGIDIAAAGALAVAALRVSRVSAAAAEGAVLRVTAAAGELSVLDVGVDQVTAATGDGLGLAVLSAGDAALYGGSVERVSGARATGVLLAVAGETVWESGSITDVRGTAGGAAGARVLVRGGPARVRLHAVRVEAVGAAQPGATARPPRSWLDLAGGTGDGPDWLGAATAGDALLALPALGAAGHDEEIAGLALAAPGDVEGGPGAVEVTGCVLNRVSGTALQVDAGGRAVAVRGTQAWTALRGAWIDGDDVLLAQLTWHRHRSGIELGPASVRLVDVIITDVETGLPVVGADPADVAIASFTGRNAPAETGTGWPFRLAPLELAVPADLGTGAELVRLYLNPGPRTPLPPGAVAGGLAPAADVDLRLPPGSPLHRRAVRVPGDGAVTPFVGAWPDTVAGCTLRDPLVTPLPPPAPPATPGPLVDYLARDARSLLAVMLERARVTMPDWTETTPADQTRMLFELLANRMDRIAYQQEVALAEGFFGAARLRRSVEDHARLVDYRPDPGLSATAMLRFDTAPPLTGPVTIPADTVVVNRDPAIEAVVYTTEGELALHPDLVAVPLASAVHRAATSAELDGHLDVETGRWLVLAGVDPEHPELVDPARPAHVVRVTRSEAAGAVTRVFWDFRRASPVEFDPATTRVLGNVVPAHHGMPLAPLTGDTAGWGALGEVLRPWREQVSLVVDNRGGDVREVRLPHDPVSVQAGGWPFPGDETSRPGVTRLAVRVDGEEWAMVDSLAASGPFDEHVALRPADDGAHLCTGNGVNGVALPRGEVRIDVETRIGLGARGNVGAGVLTQVLAFGELGDLPGVLPDVADREQVLLASISVTNPLSAIGGRDPESLARLRATAPLAGRLGLAAVVPADYERLLGARRDVAGVRARYRRAGVRDVVRVTVMLAAEDALAAAGEAGTVERLRRWVHVRAAMEQARLLGTDVELVPPEFVPLDVDISVDAEQAAGAEQVRAAVIDALAGRNGLLTPHTGALGGDVRIDVVYQRLVAVPGVTAARVRRLRRLVAGAPDHAGDGLLPVADHEVAVLRDPLGRTHHDGVLTVTVCGGVT